ncbi:Or46a family protein [Megaselia abdita]
MYSDKVIKFYSFSISFFIILGQWQPAFPIGWKREVYKLSFLSISLYSYVFYNFLFVMNLMINISDLETVFDVFYMLANTIASMTKCFAVRYYSNSLRDILEYMSSAHFQPSNKNQINMFSKTFSENQWVNKGYSRLCFVALFGVVIKPIFLKDGSYPISAYLFLDDSFLSQRVLQYVSQSIATAYFCFCDVAFDTAICSFFMFVACQLEMFADQIRNMKGSEIKYCVEKHLKILNLYNRIVSCVLIPLTVQMASSAVVILCALYQVAGISGGDFSVFVASFGYLFAMIIQLYLPCYYGNRITSKSEDLALALYDSNWYEWKLKDKKAMMFMLARLQRPVIVKAFGIMNFNLEVFSNIINTSYSFFNIIRNTNK